MNRNRFSRKRQCDDSDACCIWQSLNWRMSMEEEWSGLLCSLPTGGHWTNNCSGQENDSKGKGKGSNHKWKKHKGGGGNSANATQSTSTDTHNTSCNVSNHVVMTQAANKYIYWLLWLVGWFGNNISHCLRQTTILCLPKNWWDNNWCWQHPCQCHWTWNSQYDNSYWWQQAWNHLEWRSTHPHCHRCSIFCWTLCQMRQHVLCQ